MRRRTFASHLFVIALLSIAIAPCATLRAQTSAQPLKTLTGQAAFTDWNQQQPGIRHKITLADLPEPKADEAVSNQPHVIARPANAWPIALQASKSPYRGGDTTPCNAPTTSSA